MQYIPATDSVERVITSEELMKQSKRQFRDATARAAEEAANQGHYLDRLQNIAIAIEDRESEMAVMALRQLHAFCNSKPAGTDGMQYEISIRLLIKCEHDWKFTKDQMNRLWYGVHWDAHGMFDLKFPYENTSTDKMKSNTSRGVA